MFVINGTSIPRLTSPDWQDNPGDSQALGGHTPVARWRRLIAQTSVLSATEWNALRLLEGSQVTITAPPYADRNAAAWQTYYGVIFERLDGRHEGPVVVGVTAEFLVRV